MRRAWTVYLAVLAACSLAPTLAAFAFNRAMDPLWYGSGSLIYAENFPYNERVSKTNHLLRRPGAYDCVVFGSSRATLLDASHIAGHRCFNYSFSNGHVDEFLQLAPFFVERSGAPKLVVVAVDGFHFVPHGLPSLVPDFVRTGERPPLMVQSYLSLDVLDFNLRAVVSRSHRTRFYRAPDFVCDVMPTAGRYTPPSRIDPADPYGSLPPSPTNTIGPFQASAAARFGELRKHFPGAELVAYVPPLTAYHVAYLEAAGTLTGYLDAMYDASRFFDRFHDFSVPSALTANPANTYDGSHFYPRINDRIAAALSTSAAGDALPVHRLTRAEYQEAFRTRLAEFTRRSGVTVATRQEADARSLARSPR